MAEEEHDHGYCEAEARAEPEGTIDPSTGFLDEMEGYTISSDYDPPLIPIELIKRLSLKPNEKSHVVVAKGEDGEFYNIGEAKKELLNAAERDMTGSGRGPAHRIPTGKTARKLAVAVAKIYKNLYGEELPPANNYGVYYREWYS